MGLTPPPPVLFLLTSKAFERVNPYWILHLLRIRGAPRWVITYARFVLFRRRVMHKVQGRLLPSRTIPQGVDMGRSFSVYLFCFAMDPLFHYLNRIYQGLSQCKPMSMTLLLLVLLLILSGSVRSQMSIGELPLQGFMLIAILAFGLASMMRWSSYHDLLRRKKYLAIGLL